MSGRAADMLTMILQEYGDGDEAFEVLREMEQIASQKESGSLTKRQNKTNAIHSERGTSKRPFVTGSQVRVAHLQDIGRQHSASFTSERRQCPANPPNLGLLRNGSERPLVSHVTQVRVSLSQK